MLTQENLNFLNVRNAGFWLFGRLFTLLRMPSLQNLGELFWGPPSFKPNIFCLTRSPL